MLVGVDIGSQSLKAIVTDSGLVPLGEASRGYRPSFPAPGHAEQDPRDWERALGPAIAEALAAAGVAPSAVTALGICGQLDGCVPVTASGAPAGNCLLWMDRRAHAVLADIPPEDVHERTGIVPDASHLAAKIGWLRRHRPDASAARFHQPVSYMVERLTGAAVTDHALASTSMVYALAARGYDEHLLGLFGVSRGELPAIAEAGDRAGVLNAQGSALSGLPQGRPVAVGTGDDFSAPLGAGLSRPDVLSVAVGTGEVVGSLFPRPLIDGERLVETHPYPAGGFFVENPGWLSGGAVVWLMDLLGIAECATFDTLAAKAPPGADGLLFLPALTGAMAPRWNAEARGCFYGLTPAHGASHMARALLEGTGFAMRDVIGRLRALGAAPASIAMMGGGSRSRLWAQIRADVAGLPVTLPRHAHASLLGAAMLAGVAGGSFSGIAQATALAPGLSARMEPDPDADRLLEQAYGRYRQLYESLTPMFGK